MFYLSEDSGIEIRSDKTIQVKADGDIAAQSATKVELKVKDKLYIVGGMNLAQRVAASIPMSKTKKSSSSLSSKVKKFSRAGLAVLSSIPTQGWGSASKKALAVSVSLSKVKKTSTKNKNQTNKKTSKRLSSLKNLLKRLSQKSRYGRMYTNARKLSSE